MSTKVLLSIAEKQRLFHFTFKIFGVKYLSISACNFFADFVAIFIVVKYFRTLQNICHCPQEEAPRQFTGLQPLAGHFASPIHAIMQ